MHLRSKSTTATAYDANDYKQLQQELITRQGACVVDRTPVRPTLITSSPGAPPNPFWNSPRGNSVRDEPHRACTRFEMFLTELVADPPRGTSVRDEPHRACTRFEMSLTELALASPSLYSVRDEPHRACTRFEMSLTELVLGSRCSSPSLYSVRVSSSEHKRALSTIRNTLPSGRPRLQTMLYVTANSQKLSTGSSSLSELGGLPYWGEQAHKASQHNFPYKYRHAMGAKKLYEDMKIRIEDAATLGRIPKETRSKYDGFSRWDSYSSRCDHDTILQILLHKKDARNSEDVDGFILPTLVYLAREKRPQYHHNYKAGAMNAMIRVSSKISNAKIILTVDCDMHSNNSQSVRDALCFYMDEEKGHDIAFVQFPQIFENMTKNDLYASSMLALSKVEFYGSDGYGGPSYIGTCCFHRRDALCGRKYSSEYWNDLKSENDHFIIEANLHELEEKSKALASCTYEENTLWGKEMGFKYGCLVEDVITGLSIHMKGWKSMYYSPMRKAFLGFAPTTLLQTLVQHKRWAEGHFQILFSNYSLVWHAPGKINLGLIMGYMHFNLWATTCLPILCYSIIPSLFLLKGIPLFPKIYSPWIIPFAYVILGQSTHTLLESLIIGGTIQGWWNDLRMWLYKGTSSYPFALIHLLLKLFGLSDPPFNVTPKILDQEASQRYEKEVMEFGASCPFFTVLATLALFNLFCLLDTLKELLLSLSEGSVRDWEEMVLQVSLCGFLVFINFPLYEGLFLRRDKGRLPTSLAIKSIALALSAFILSKIFI
ncbi:hypothetical protein RIF29_05157 [Crotalaria pallida]|uniref:Cellulose synthase-like protein E6 n=1 Tax=Crotalaria pallida TaxID=3830 RepID=A0AAN9J2R6_CROPI